MPLVTTKDMFEKSMKEHFAIGAFNVNNMELIQGIVDAAAEENSPVITPNMINNYVKQEVLKPPVKKKYNKTHLAYLFVICILKRLMSISEKW